MVNVVERSFEMNRLECVYIGSGEPQVSFRSCPRGQSFFYLLSVPAHRKLPTCKAGAAEASVI